MFCTGLTTSANPVWRTRFERRCCCRRLRPTIGPLSAGTAAAIRWSSWFSKTNRSNLYRVKKTFGTASAFLDFSRDGVDFSPDARGRQVDERLSEILKWGIAPPGGKGRPKGMPVTFLTSALLAEQDRREQHFHPAVGGGFRRVR